MRGKRKFQEFESGRVKTLTNRQLYDEFLELAPGDDYDGCFTEPGEITFQFLKNEMELRLADWLMKSQDSYESSIIR